VQGPKASHRLGKKFGAVLLFSRLISGGKRQVKQAASTLSCFLFFSAIHFLLLRGVFSVLFRQAFAKPASFITPMTNGWVLRINTDARSGASVHGGQSRGSSGIAGCRNAVLYCDLRDHPARAFFASRLAAGG
jgi:hypothetical protein